MRKLLLLILISVNTALQFSNNPAVSIVSKLVVNRPFIKSQSGVLVDKDIDLQTDFFKARGDSYYDDAGIDFQRGLDNLVDATYTVERCSALSTGVVVNWRVEFLPYSVEALAFIGKLIPGITVVLYDILDKERFVATGFSWEKLQKFIGSILTKGEMLLPKAVILGQSQFDIIQDDEMGAYILTKSVERLNLVRSVDGGLLKNRVIASHLVEYASAMKPASISFDDWDDITVTRLQIQRVPGMRQFDIDGLEPERQQALVRTGNSILGYSFGVVSLFSLAFALQVLDKLNN
jgi:hypothetical protein